MSAQEFFSEVKEHFLAMKDVKKQGQSLKCKKKMFVMLSKGNYVVKLPKERVEELLTSGDGLSYDPGTGKTMKEWIIIPIDSKEKWIEYAQEAKEFVKTLIK